MVLLLGSTPDRASKTDFVRGGNPPRKTEKELWFESEMSPLASHVRTLGLRRALLS